MTVISKELSAKSYQQTLSAKSYQQSIIISKTQLKSKKQAVSFYTI